MNEQNPMTGSNIHVENASNTIVANTVNVKGNLNINGYENINMLNSLHSIKLQCINQIKDTLYDNNPDTALRQIEQFEKNIPHSNFDNKTRAEIALIKGMCYYEQGNSETGEELYLESWRLDSENKECILKSIRVFIDRSNFQNANQLLAKFLEQEPYNADAWAAKIFIDLHSNPDTTIDEEFKKLPPQITALKSQIIKLRSRLMGYYSNDSEMILNVCEEELDPTNFITDEINFENRYYWLNIATILVSRAVFNYMLYSDGVHPSVKKHPDLHRGIAIYKAVFDLLEYKEKYKYLNDARFWYAYAKYCINETILEAEEVISSFKKIEKSDIDSQSTLVAFTLCQTKQYEKLHILFEKSLKNPGVILAKGFAYLEQQKIADAKRTFLSFFEAIKTTDEYTLNLFLSLTERGLLSRSELRDVWTEISSKTNDKQIENLLLLWINWDDLTSGERKEQIDKIREELDINDKTIILLTSALYYIENKNYDEALKILEFHIDFDVDMSEHILYIRALLESWSNEEELLKRLSHWRKCNFKKILHFYHREITILSFIPNWEQLLEVAQEGINHFPYDRDLWLSYAQSLSILDKVDELKIVLKKVSGLVLEETLAIRFAVTAYKCELFEYVLELLFPSALSDSNQQAQLHYHIAVILTDIINTDNKLSVVTDDCWVQLQSESSSFHWEVIKRPLNTWYSQLLGKGIGDMIIDQSAGIPKSYKIIKITNKYLGLYLKIEEKIAKNNLPGMGIQALDVPSGDPEALKQILMTRFGEQGEKQQKYVDSLSLDYIKGHKTFTNFVRQCDDNPVLAYYSLVNDSQNGIRILHERGIDISPEYFTKSNAVFTIDFSSFLLFQLLSEQLKLKYPHVFFISAYIKEILETESQEIKINKPPGMSLKISRDSIKAFPHPSKETQIEFYNKLLSWLIANCKIIKNTFKLKLIGQAIYQSKEFYKSFVNDEWLKYCIDTAMMGENLNQSVVLIADDLIFRNQLRDKINTISSEMYLKCFFPDQYEKEILPFLLKNNYYNLCITSQFLEQEYKKLLNEEDNLYHQGIKNILGNSDALIPHLFTIYSTNSKLIQQKRLLSQHAIYCCLGNLSISKNLYNNIKNALSLRFRFLPNMVKFVLEDIDIVLRSNLRY